MPKKNVSVSDVACLSPFENLSSLLAWLTSVKGLPLSVLQAVSIMSRGGEEDMKQTHVPRRLRTILLCLSGSCDPFLEDNKLSAQYRVARLSKAILEMLELFYVPSIPADENILAVRKQFRGMFRDPEGSSIPSSISLPEDLEARLRSFDVGGGGKHAELPLELLRNYMQKDDADLSNSQLSAVLWSVSRSRSDEELLRLSLDQLAIQSAEENAPTTITLHKQVKTDLKTSFSGKHDTHFATHFATHC